MRLVMVLASVVVMVGFAAVAALTEVGAPVDA